MPALLRNRGLVATEALILSCGHGGSVVTAEYYSFLKQCRNGLPPLPSLRSNHFLYQSVMSQVSAPPVAQNLMLGGCACSSSVPLLFMKHNMLRRLPITGKRCDISTFVLAEYKESLVEAMASSFLATKAFGFRSFRRSKGSSRQTISHPRD